MALSTVIARVRDGALPAVEVVQESLRRIELQNAAVNAVTSTDATRALAEAARIDSLSATERARLPLAGMPLLVKDIEDVEGWPTTFGAFAFRDAPRASRDSPVVARLRAAGAVVVGRSNTCEFAFEGYTSNRLYGSTMNPWRRDWSPGGSSGGSAAALAAGMVPLATASDGGGSVRIPASLCGLLGLKPSRGVVDGARWPAWIDCHSDAILARGASDLALLTTLLTGPPRLGRHQLESPSTIRRVVLVPRFTGTPSPLDARRAAHHRELLEQALGLVVEEMTVDQLFADEPELPTYWEDDWYSATSAEQAHLLGSETVEQWSEAWDPQFLDALRRGFDVTTQEYLGIRRRSTASQRRLDEILVPGTVLAAPVLTGPGYTPDGCAPGFATPGSPPGLTQTVLANLTGHPAISLPAGLDELGLPHGLQILSGRQQDLTLVEVARLWEEVHPWPRAAPGFTPFEGAWGTPT